MSRECRDVAVAIDAAAGAKDELPAEVIEHVARCESCARRQAAVHKMASLTGGDEISPDVAITLARTALDRSSKGRTLFWAAPLLSASMSIACLILYFGLSVQPLVSAEIIVGDTQATAPSDQNVSYIPSLEVSGELSLPESFQAINGMVLTDSGEEP